MRLNPEKVLARMALVGIPDLDALALVLGPDIREDGTGRRRRRSFGISLGTLRQYMAGGWVKPAHGRRIARALSTQTSRITLTEAEGGASTRDKTEWVYCYGSVLLARLVQVSFTSYRRVEDELELPHGFLQRLSQPGAPKRVDARRIRSLARYFRIRTDQAVGVLGGPCKHPEWLEDEKFRPGV